MSAFTEVAIDYYVLINRVFKNPENLEPDQPQTQIYYIQNRILLVQKILPVMSLASSLLSHPVSD